MATKRKAAKRPKSVKKRSASPKSVGPTVRCRSRRMQRRTVKQRVAALADAPLAVCENDQDLAGDAEGPAQQGRAREGAACGAAVASGSELQRRVIRGAAAATTSPRCARSRTTADPELRQRVLGILMREKDGFAQKKLLEGLEEPRQGAGPAREGAATAQLRRARRGLFGGARDRQEAAERRRQARGPAAARGRRQRRSDVREAASLDKNELREIRQIRRLRAACAAAGEAAGDAREDPARQVGLRRHQGHKPDRA